MKASYIVLVVLCSALLLACNDEKGTPEKVDSSSSNNSANSTRDGMPAVAFKHSCDACHTINAKKVGPSWMEVSKKYKNDPEAEAMLIAKVRKGGYGNWGTMPMPPNIAPSDAEIKELVEFILKLNK